MSNDGLCNLYNDGSVDMIEIVTYTQAKNLLPVHLLGQNAIHAKQKSQREKTLWRCPMMVLAIFIMMKVAI
ncbi:hypothetical protein C0J52_23530 [Blattella germanica]|nr:hypothetical protein C0J52_23530 [Blattella germanica]